MSKKKVVTKTTITEEIITDEKTQIVCILDRSGSMGSIIEDAIGGLNEFINQQKKLEDDATMSVVLFDDRYEILYDNIPIKEVKNFDKSTWYPRGTTALYDAIGKTVNDVKNTHSKLKEEEKPDKVLVCIVTDGMENASREYTCDNIKELISKSEKDGWSFIYLAANQDAFDVGTSFGISSGNTLDFTADGAGMENVSASLTNATTYYRSTTAKDGDYDNLMTNLGTENSEENDED